MNRIEGKLILITGASSGIGMACARHFAAEGARLALWARRLDRLEALAADVVGDDRASVFLARVDVRDREQVAGAVERLVAEAGVPDVLLNNAGLAAGFDLLHEGDPEDWDRMIDTNVKGLLNVTRAVLPHMVEAGRGHVINIGSTAGHMTYPRGNVYAATKYAVRALTEGMSLDLAGTPVRVSSVSPGLVETDFSVVRFHGDEERARSVYKGLETLTGDDIADIVVFVAARPPHVNIADVVVLPTAQRNVFVVHRES